MTTVADVFVAAAAAAVEHADELSRLDAVAGDGDLGVTVGNAAEALRDAIASSGDGELPALLSVCGAAIARKAPSTAGTLIATGLLGAARAARESTATGVTMLADLLDAAEGAIAGRGKAAPGVKTMIDAIVPACKATRTVAEEGGTLFDALRAAAAAADDGAKATAAMVRVSAEPCGCPTAAAGSEDAGARLIAIVFGGAAHAVQPEG